ncbi:ribonuclease HII [Symbiobacterium terraclitae]|uniref:ribonuclease HII n=1 Tax=Symbiobacterium terraclitae TaxID=557451 RepID=UPI0035B5466E
MADLRLERVLWRHGCQVIGLDEAGRGPLAGPVVAAACILPEGAVLPGVNDSKRLTEKQREAAFAPIQEAALGWGVGIVDAARIDEINILRATFEAMAQAVEAARAMAAVRLGRVAEAALLVDGSQRLPQWTGWQRPVVGGDRKSLSIAAASILAKVTRDRLMVEYDQLYPGYGFARNKGYGSQEHLAALEQLGPCPIHRRTFIGPRQLRFF